MLAALATLQELSQPDFYPHIHKLADRLYDGFNQLLANHNLPGRMQVLGTRFGIYFGVEEPVRNYQDAARRDTDMMHRFVRACFQRGIYFQTIGHAIGHSGFSGAHAPKDIDWALEQFDQVFAEIKR